MGQISRALRHVIAAALLLSAGASLTDCSKLQQAAGQVQPGKAYLDSQIPPGLSPQYFPPEGFVWGAYRAGSLPEARYGVASPPINPKAQVLILADADYPAETYFQLMRQLLDNGYGVWLLEAPGQGGAGHYLLQGDRVFTPNYRNAEITTSDFIRDIVHPTPDKPLFVVGTGYSAVHVLALSTVLKNDNIEGFIAFDPWTGGAITTGAPWHSTDTPATYWGGIAQTWQTANPDLRLRVKSDGWRAQMQKAYADLNGLRLPVVSLSGKPAEVLVLEPSTQNAGNASRLCAHLNHCHLQNSTGPVALGGDIAGFIHAQLPGTH